VAPIILSGGLTPDNVAAAIAATAPYGVDVASGTESSPGVKDPAKLQAFHEAVRAAEAEAPAEDVAASAAPAAGSAP
jgi:phosphoribosylanthranilate isomerase